MTCLACNNLGYTSCNNCKGGTGIKCCHCEGLGLVYDSDYDKTRECQVCDGEGDLTPCECPFCFDGKENCSVCDGLYT